MQTFRLHPYIYIANIITSNFQREDTVSWAAWRKLSSLQFFMLFAGCQIWHEITAVDHSYYPRISYIPRRTRILSLGINTMQIQTWQSRTLCTVLLLTKRKLRQKKKADFSPFCLQNDVPLGCFVIVLRLKEEEKGLLFEEGGPWMPFLG